jgi:hypothetical protein
MNERQLNQLGKDCVKGVGNRCEYYDEGVASEKFGIGVGLYAKTLSLCETK